VSAIRSWFLAVERERPRFEPRAFLLYFGALLAAAAATSLLQELWEDHGAGVMVVFSGVTLAFFAALALAAVRRGRWLASGLLAFVAVSLVPLLVYAFERWIDVWPRAEPGDVALFHSTVRAGWVAMEVVTILAAVGAIALVRFPFLVAPLGVALWYLSMDLAPLFFGDHPSGDERAYLAVAVGIVLMVAAALVEIHGFRPYGFWGHVFGLLSFGGGLLWLWRESDGGWAAIAAIAVVALLAGLVLERPAYAVFCAFGLLGAFDHFLEKWSDSNLISPIALGDLVSSWEGPLALVLFALVLMALGEVVGRYGDAGRVWIARRTRPVA